ncbi:hypothetical protein PoB_002227600 [Plakobranchus ocellatus]|uniref:ER-bound oxygenase mpaB/mpaB'/Rubber oxygenase catalytic domain-containing protein n=1 Tax=Plakobranchus ocellatus TaxID=259542 RepID=A0AAV3ZMN0_9GAST|nr:hypothetical protein PoB_002227600 [Plakobranchus ocellatus]
MGSTKTENKPMVLKRLEDLEPGKELDGDNGVDFSIPNDFDMAKFRRGRKFYFDNFFCTLTAHFFVLVIGMVFPDFLTPLVYTKQSHTPALARKRYIATVKHVASWHFGNVWRPGSDAQKSILAVRRMHHVVETNLKKDGLENNLSQYHMGLVQSAFVAFPIMYPSEFGLRCSDSDLDDYVYFWYGIGHLLGIDSKNNLCTEGLTQARAFCKQVQDDIYIECFKKPSDDFFIMTEAVLEGWKDFFKGTLSVNVIRAYFEELAGQKRRRLKFPDNMKFVFWKILFFALRNIPWVAKYFNSLMRKKFRIDYFEE